MVEYRYSTHAATLSLSRARGHRASNGLPLMRELERRCGCTLSVVPCDAAQGLYSTVYVHEHLVGVFCEFYDTGTSTARPAGHGTAGSAGFLQCSAQCLLGLQALCLGLSCSLMLCPPCIHRCTLTVLHPLPVDQHMLEERCPGSRHTTITRERVSLVPSSVNRR